LIYIEISNGYPTVGISTTSFPTCFHLEFKVCLAANVDYELGSLQYTLIVLVDLNSLTRLLLLDSFGNATHFYSHLMHSFGIQWTFAFNSNLAVHSIFIDVFNQQQQQNLFLSHSAKQFYFSWAHSSFIALLPHTHTHTHAHLHTHIQHTHTYFINKVSYVMIYAFCCCLWRCLFHSLFWPSMRISCHAPFSGLAPASK